MTTVRNKTRKCNAKISIDRRYSFICSFFQQLAGYDLFNCQDDTILTPYPYRGTSVLYCFDSVLNLGCCKCPRSSCLDKDVLGNFDRLGRRWSSKDRSLYRWMSRFHIHGQAMSDAIGEQPTIVRSNIRVSKVEMRLEIRVKH